MDLRFLAFIGMMAVIIIGMVALDYRRLGRRPLRAINVEQKKKSAWVSWPLTVTQLKNAQVVERHSRWLRVRAILWRNLRVATYFAIGGGAALLLLVLYSAVSGRAAFEASFLIIVLYPALIIYPIILAATLFVGGDALGVAGMKAVLGIGVSQATTVYLDRNGVLWDPGGYQPFTYPPTDSKILDGPTRVLLIITTQFNRRQDFYVPIPPDRETEAEQLRQRLYIA